MDRYLATLPGYDARRGYAFSLGAYLGELVIRVCGGHWTRDEATGQPGVLLPSGRMSLPMDETARRLEVGMSHGLVAFFEARADGRRVGPARDCGVSVCRSAPLGSVPMSSPVTSR